MPRLEVIETELMEFEKKEFLENKQISPAVMSQASGFIYMDKITDNDTVVALIKTLCESAGISSFKFISGELSFENDIFPVKILKFDDEADGATFILYFSDRIRNMSEVYTVKEI